MTEILFGRCKLPLPKYVEHELNPTLFAIQTVCHHIPDSVDPQIQKLLSEAMKRILEVITVCQKVH